MMGTLENLDTKHYKGRVCAVSRPNGRGVVFSSTPTFLKARTVNNRTAENQKALFVQDLAGLP